MGIGIKFELNWECITLRYMENNTFLRSILQSCEHGLHLVKVKYDEGPRVNGKTKEVAER